MKRQYKKDRELLTKSEFMAMRILWDLPEESAFAKDILEKYEEPKPAYTTLATFLKILVRKGFLSVRKLGNMLYYTPIVTEEQYRKTYLNHTLRTLYQNDPVALVEFMSTHLDLTDEQRKEMAKLIK